MRSESWWAHDKYSLLLLLQRGTESWNTRWSSPSSVQFKMVWSMYLEKPTLFVRSFHIAFETVPMFVWLTMALSSFQGRSSSASSFHTFPHFSPPGDQWCYVLGFVPAGGVSSSSTLTFYKLGLISIWPTLDLFWTNLEPKVKLT